MVAIKKTTVDEYRTMLAGKSAVKRHKYRAIETMVDGIKFPSRKEAARYRALKALERAGGISGLRLQVPFEYVVTFAANGRQWSKPEKYVADFVYFDGGREVVEDVKGFRTDVYRRKKRIVEKLWGITILET